MNEPLRLRARMAAPIKEVRHALTDATALRIWLAEYAEVDLPTRYEFWGRHTPEGDAPHQRPLHIDEHTLRISWLIDGEETTVEFSLAEESATSTIVTLSQSHFPSWEEAIAETSIRGVLHTYWALALANLSDHLDGRELTPKVDFTSADLSLEILIGAPPEAVYESLINPAIFRRWFGANVDIEPYVGGRFAMGGFELDPAPAKIVELVPGQKMSLAWGETISTWELAGSEGKTRISLVQSGFDENNPPYGAWSGWLGGVAELRRYHELSDWRGIWLALETPGMPEGMLTIE